MRKSCAVTWVEIALWYHATRELLSNLISGPNKNLTYENGILFLTIHACKS